MPVRAIDGLGGVLQEIDDDFPELHRIHVNIGKIGRKVEFERHVWGNRVVDQLFQLEDHIVRILPLESDGRVSRIGHQLFGERAALGCGLADGREQFILVKRISLFLCGNDVLNDGEDVVHIVRDARGERSKAFHPVEGGNAFVHFLAHLALALLAFLDLLSFFLKLREHIVLQAFFLPKDRAYDEKDTRANRKQRGLYKRDENVR